MILKEYDISIRLPQERTVDTGIVLVQNDKDVYKLNIRIFDGVYEIDYTKVTSATITFSKADKNVVQSEGVIIEVDKLTYTLGTNEISYPGRVLASIQLWGTTERLTTARFSMQVDKDLITEDAVESTSEFPILQRVVQDAEGIVPLLPEIEQTVQEFPAIREFFDTAETSETQRKANEVTRQTQETARQASIADIEDRFDNLTASQQQDAEVIDARMGKASLKAKLQDMDTAVETHLAERASDAAGVHGLKIESGIWTPIIRTTGVQPTINYNTKTYGKYYKIGNLVSIQGAVRTDSVDITGATGFICIAGFPFASSSGGSQNLIVSYVHGWNTNNPCTLEIAGGSVLAYMHYRSSANGATIQSRVADLATGENCNYIIFSGTYVPA